MSGSLRRLAPLAAFAALAAMPQASSAAGIVLSRDSLAEACTAHAKLAGEGLMTPTFAVATCTAALEVEGRPRDELAGVYNNRGVVQLTMMDAVAAARADFEAAAALEPDLGESYANRGAALVAEKRFAEAIVEIERGMALGLREPWKAHFNRALARENLNDIRGAYQDYRAAVTLRPGWAMAETELARFSVTPAAR